MYRTHLLSESGNKRKRKRLKAIKMEVKRKYIADGEEVNRGRRVEASH